MISKEYILTVTLNPAVDKIIKVSDFKAGRDHVEKDLILCAGGKGINVSRALSVLGEYNLATGILCGQAGRLIADWMRKEKIPEEFLTTAGETRTNLTVIDPLSGAITRVIERGPYMQKKVFEEFEVGFNMLLDKASDVVFSGANANGFDDAAYYELINMTKKKGVRASLDTRGAPLRCGIKARPFILKSNIEEAGYLAGENLNSLEKVKKAAASLAKKGIDIVLITMAKEGAVACSGKEIVHTKAPIIKTVNNVGSGDVFLAAFISANKNGKTIKDSLKFAVACGSASTLTERPGIFNMNDAKKYLKGGVYV